MKFMKGIILAGGTGSRLHPVTIAQSKQLLPIYDKPMIFYPLSVLMLAGIREIQIITTPHDLKQFQKLLGSGDCFGVDIQYTVQEHPNGLAEAFILSEGFIGDSDVALILGDNLFYGQGFTQILELAKLNVERNRKATIFGYQVNDPERFGIVEFNCDNKVLSVEEKPQHPKSNFAVTGLYFYPNDVIKKSKLVKPSKRGELEITTINNMYLEQDLLNVQLLGRGFAWLDTGTCESLLEAGQFIQVIEQRQGLKVACLEEIALNNSWISLTDIEASPIYESRSNYGSYLKKLVSEYGV